MMKIEREARINTPTRNFGAMVELRFDEPLSGPLPNHMTCEFLNYGDDPQNQRRVWDSDVTVFLGGHDYKLAMTGELNSATFTLAR